MKKILVTGANGFIGRTLCRILTKNGHFVRGALRSKEKIVQCPDCAECVVVGDIGPETDWRGALNEMDAVVHTAGRAHVMQETQAYPLDEYRKINTQGTKKLVEQAEEAGIKRMIFLSTVKVLGEETLDGNSFNENDTPAPADDYALSKWEAERILQQVVFKRKLEVVILRLPLVYGPGVKGNFFKMMQWIEKGFWIPFASTRNQRSLIYVENLVDVIIQCLYHPKAANQIFFVSDNKNVSTAELIQSLAAAMNRQPQLVPVPGWLEKAACKMPGVGLRVHRLTSSLAVSPQKIKTTVGWEAPYHLQEGLRKTSEWFCNNKIRDKHELKQ